MDVTQLFNAMREEVIRLPFIYVRFSVERELTFLNAQSEKPLRKRNQKEIVEA